MDISERRMFGALFLLLGVSFLVIGIHVDQMNTIIQMLKTPLTF